MDVENMAYELSEEDLEGIDGGVITQLRKYRIRAKLLHDKRTEGLDLDAVLEGIKYDPEEMAYVRSIWDQI